MRALLIASISPEIKNLFCFSQSYVLLAPVNWTQNIWNTLTRLLVVLLGIAAVLGIAIWYEPVVQENQRMREQKFQLDQKIEQETKISKQLEIQLRSFQDPTLEKTLVERLARERLSYAKPGENVIHFDPPGAAH